MKLKRIVGVVFLIVCFGSYLDAKPLPFWISLQDASSEEGSLLSLQGITEKVISRWETFPQNARTLGRIQTEFERIFFNEVTNLESWADSKSVIKKTRQATSKWINSYSLEPSVPSHRFEALTEYIRSMQYLDSIQSEEIRVTDSEIDRFEKDSQWCGKYDEATCSSRGLFKVFIHSKNTSNRGLYEFIERRIREITESGNRAEKIHLLNYRILWNPPLTKIRYGVTFYLQENRNNSVSSLTLLGYDLIYTHEATPAPALGSGSHFSSSDENHEKEKTAHHKVWEKIKLATGYPFGVIIGVKNAAFEVAKMPLSFLAGFFGRGHPVQYPLQNLKAAGTALWMEVRTPKDKGPVKGFVRLLGDIPIVGSVFQVNTNPNNDHLEPSKKIFLTRGIYGGDRLEQDTGLWLASAHHEYPEAEIYTSPYEFGTVTDVVWSMFNLSHGPAYVLANDVMKSASRSDRIYLVGHSAGVQRVTIGSRILTQNGFDVRQIMGISGPSLGQACVNIHHPEPFKILLSPSGDIVSIVGIAAKGLATVVDMGTRRPAKLLGSVLLRWDRRRMESWNRRLDRLGVSNARQTFVPASPTAKHETPFRLSLAGRVVFDKFIRQEFQDIFRDDFKPSFESVEKIIPYRK